MQAVRIGLPGDIGVRQLANIAYGAACSGMGKQLGALFMGLACAAKWRMADFHAQDIANTAWAFATAG